jgi:hypothetical protein
MTTANKDWAAQAVALHNTGTMSWRDISRMINVPKSTVSDLLRAYTGAVEKEVQAEEAASGSTHLVIPDTQVRPGISLEYLRWIGEYIVRKQPDTIVHLGDHADMPSLSSYDKGKRSAEGKRVSEDIAAAIEGMKVLLTPMWNLQERQRQAGEPVYKPRMVILYGNHCDRINRHVDSNPEMHGFLSLDDLKYEEMGWETVPFLTPINIDGINYCHYFPNVMTGKPLSGTAQNMLKTIGESFTMGHRQLLDVTTRFLPTNGQQQWGLICGAAYVHDESYKGVTGNRHWRGIVVKHNCKAGSYDPLFISMDWLQSEYGNR